MNFNSIDWVATGQIILPIITVIVAAGWTFNSYKNKKITNVKSNIHIQGSGNSTNIAGRDIKNDNK